MQGDSEPTATAGDEAASMFWRLLLVAVAMTTSTGVVWYLGLAGMRAGAVRAFAALAAVGAGLTWLLLRRSSSLRVVLGAVMLVSAAVTVRLVSVAPIMPDRLLGAYPPEAIPVGAQHRETRAFGDTIGLSGDPSVIRWYEVPVDDAVLERQIRHALQRSGWRLRPPVTNIFDFEAVSPDGRFRASIAVGVESAKRRFESGSDEPLPRSAGHTIVEVAIRLHDGLEPPRRSR